MSRGLGKLQRKILEALADSLEDAPDGVWPSWLTSQVWEEKYVKWIEYSPSGVEVKMQGWKRVGSRANLYRALDSLGERDMILFVDKNYNKHAKAHRWRIKIDAKGLAYLTAEASKLADMSTLNAEMPPKAKRVRPGMSALSTEVSTLSDEQQLIDRVQGQKWSLEELHWLRSHTVAPEVIQAIDAKLASLGE